MPKAIGSQNANISQRLLAAPSQILRPSRPQLPPLTYCSISRTSGPVVRPSQNMNENSHEWRNRSHLLKAAAKATAPTENNIPTTKEGVRILSIRVGGAKSAGVTRTPIWLIAFLPPTSVFSI